MILIIFRTTIEDYSEMAELKNSLNLRQDDNVSVFFSFLSIKAKICLRAFQYL